MKRLLTYLGLLATLLAMPYHAKANNMYLRFWNGAEKVVEMNHDGGNTAWHYDFYTSDDYWKNNREIYVFPRVDNNDNYKMQSHLPAAAGENTSGTEYNFYKYIGNETTNKYDYKITLPSDIATKLYKVTVWVTDYNQNLSDPSCKVKVTWEAVDATNLTLRTDAYDWAAVRYDEYDSGTNTYIWDLTSLSDFTNTSKFKLELDNRWYGGNVEGTNVGNSWVNFTSPGNDSKPNFPETTGNNIARLEAKYDNGWKVQIVSGNAIVKHDYYWVSPQITNGEMWPAFKMVASRNRYYSGTKVIGDGKISNKYYTFTIKEDDLVRWRTKSKIEKDQTIQWYILRDDGQVVYRPVDKLDPEYLPNGGNKYDDDHTISGTLDSYVSYINFWNGSSYDGADAYMTTDTDRSGSWAFKKGYAKAHTFNLNAEKGHVLYNYTTAGASNADGYKLAGNWDAGRKVKIEISKAKTMTPYYYYNHGEVSTSLDAVKAAVSDVSKCDSIVYKVIVNRPDEGWGGLYLDVLPASSNNWNDAIRPLITLGNNLDGRALHGAMTTASSDQSLNPEASPNYLGYTFSFNATTMTYRLEFHTPDATLSPGTMDGNLNFLNSTSETINVKFSNASDGIHTTATTYSIAFGDNEDITLSDTHTNTASSFKLRYDGTNIYKDEDTTPLVTGKTVFVKIKGWDDDNNYGDVHTYQYTFYSPLTFEPKGGLFINSAKIKIQGGAKPYKWKVYKYETKKDEVSGDVVLDLHTVRSSGTFDGDYNDTDGNYRISTPGILEIEDKYGNKVISDEKNLFDFTYSTSENYDIQKNGTDYWNAAPGDRSNLLDLTWGGATMSDQTAVSHWSGDDGVIKRIDKSSYPLSQTVADLDPNKTYTVQAIVRGLGETKATATLTLEGATTKSATIDLRNASGGGEGSDEPANLSRKGNVVNKYGRVEYIEPMETEFTQKVASVGWAKVEAAAKPTAEGKLTIKLESTGDWFNLSNVTLLESANTTEGFRTTASATATSVDDSGSAGFDYRARDISSTWKKNNAYSFFDRGKNRNAVIFANDRTVIAMNSDHLADVTQNAALKAVDRRHPFNVVGSDENDVKVGTAKALYLTDMGYGGNTTDYPGDADNPVDYDQTDNITGYSRSGYTFMPKFALKAEDVVFDRILGGESYKKQTTILLPFEITVTELKKYYGNDLKVWKYNGYNLTKKTILFTEVTGTTEANVPYILTEANGKLDSRNLTSEERNVKEVAAIQNAEQHTATSDGGFTGSYIYQDIPRTASINGTTLTHFAFNPTTGKFQVIHKNGAAMKPFRAYFSVPVVIEENNNAPAFTVIFDDTTTGISESVQVDVEPTNVYTLGGVLVARNGDLSRLPKGVYIVNGKKVIK